MGLSTQPRRMMRLCLVVTALLASNSSRGHVVAFTTVPSSSKFARPTSGTNPIGTIAHYGARLSAPAKRTSSRASTYAPTDESTAPSDAAEQPSSQTTFQSKLRRLKDRMWVRETLEDLTAADFAASLDAAAEAAEAADEELSRRIGKKRAVDVENILSKLDRRIEEMCVVSTYGEASNAISCYPTGTEMSSPVSLEKGQKCYSLMAGQGMGSVVYKDEQRDALLTRIVATRQRLQKAMEGNIAQTEPEAEAEGLDDIRMQLRADQESKLDVANTTIDPYLYVRDDGTIDWDGALQDKEALKKFGTSVWSRINGQDPESIDEESVGKEQETDKAITVKIIETDAIREEKAKLDALQKELRGMTAEHTSLLNSAVQVGNAVGTVNLASLDPALRSKIRSSSDSLEKKEEEVSCQLMSYELERIYTYLDTELGNTATKGYIPLQDRLNVAEFGLLESQIASFDMQLKAGDSVDADVLAVVVDQLTDFKRRLGIDYYVTGLTYDWEAIQRWLTDLLAKTKTGLAFYVKGCKLFWNDVLYSLRLVTRALQGYTLEPREVRTLRRTFKDVITFIPVIIILIIPLSPVGHVLVFGAIQRVFPDFFPSCFTERRQNLLELYESTEYTEVIINESLQEKLTRALEAWAFVIADAAKQAYEQPDDNSKKS